jgi:hypothetical protein
MAEAENEPDPIDPDDGAGDPDDDHPDTYDD